MKLTELRLKKAKPILEKYRTELHGKGSLSVGGIKKELRECWGADCGYRELKEIFQQLAKITRYRYLAAYYMEHSGLDMEHAGRGAGVVTEFWPTLAELYGIDNYLHSPNRKQKREAFWKKLKVQNRRPPLQAAP